MATLSPLVFLGVVEALLAAAGVEPLADEPRYQTAVRQRGCRFGRAAPRTWCTVDPRRELRSGLVLTLGGSTVYGYRADDSSFPLRLQAMLEGAHPGEYQVVNLGRPCKDSTYVRRCLERAIEARPDVVVVYSGHNDYGNWGFANPSRRIFLEEHAWLYDVEVQASRTRSFSALARLLGTRERGLAAPAPVWFSGSQLEESSAVILDQFSDNLSRVVDLTARSGSALILVTVVSNLHEFPLRRADWDEVRVVPAGEPQPRRHWREHYARGVELFLSGEAESALLEFKRARDWHPSGRARSGLNEYLRTLAPRFPHVRLVDFERILDRRGAQEGIGCSFFGDESYCDRFHPNSRAHALIARAVFRRIEAIRAERSASGS